ncbi:MAG: fused MFS/spermidine synthase [Limisphaerales bacterium]
MSRKLRWLYPTAFWCLLLSGIAGLAYQIAWARYLSLLLGSTSYGVVAVLVAFMGGLALGNAWLGRFADGFRHPLRLYGWLEIGIAIYGILFPTYFELCQRGYVAIASSFAPGHPGLLAIKFLVSFAAILLPATLMGGTLPILTRLVTRSLGELRGRVAGLYFVNSLGAVIGVIAADFWWVPTYGLEATVLFAAALNALVGVIALLAQSGFRDSWTSDSSYDSATATDGAANAADGLGERFSPFELRLAIAAAGISGFVAMLYEVVWTRLLALALGSSTHAFSIMLVTFIAGIAAGAWIVGRWRNLRGTFDAFGWAELALAGFLLVSMFFYHLLPYGFYRLGLVLARSPENHVVYQFLQFLVCFAVMFVPALCLGMTLPLASRVATSELARTGRSVGVVFSVNTLGTVLGAALSGLLLLPWLGLASTLALGVALNLAIALVVLLRRSKVLRRLSLATTPALVLGLVAFAGSTLDPTWDNAFAQGLWRIRDDRLTLRNYQDRVRTLDLRYHRDGAGSTVAVAATRGNPDAPVHIDLRVNGKTDASSGGDLSTQLLSGHIPMLLHHLVEDALVVGIGSGITCGAILTHPEVERLDIVEISPEVYEAARIHFAPYNNGALDHPKARVVIDDAKSFLATANRRYDVIVTEPSNPWMAGVSGVFSLEYYESCLATLKPGGIIAQWVQVYETNDEAIRTVLATFGSVFPHFSVWQTLPGDLLLVGSAQPTAKDLDQIRRRFHQPTVLQDLRRADVLSLPALLGLQLVSEENGAFLVPPDTVRHSDYFPVLEYIAEKAFFTRRETSFLDSFDERRLRHPTTLLGAYLRETPLTIEDARTVVLLHHTAKVPHPSLVRSVLKHWQEKDPTDLLPVEIASKMEFPPPNSAIYAQDMFHARELMMARHETEPESLRMYSRYLQNNYRQARSTFHQPATGELTAVLEFLAERDPLHRLSHRLRLAELAWDLGQRERFIQLTSETLLHTGEPGTKGHFDLDYSAPGRVLHLLIETLWRDARHADAQWWADAARQSGYLDPEGRYFDFSLDMVVRKVTRASP